MKNKVTPPVTALLFFHLFIRRFLCLSQPSQRFLGLPICSVAHFGMRFTVFYVCEVVIPMRLFMILNS